MDFINCQAEKRTCNESKLSNRKNATKYDVVSKILFQSLATLYFIDCQGAKGICNKSKLSNRKNAAK
jgi:hypothetical protein